MRVRILGSHAHNHLGQPYFGSALHPVFALRLYVFEIELLRRFTDRAFPAAEGPEPMPDVLRGGRRCERGALVGRVLLALGWHRRRLREIKLGAGHEHRDRVGETVAILARGAAPQEEIQL